jgi:uncharacterized UBP type Zn finger protein
LLEYSHLKLIHQTFFRLFAHADDPDIDEPLKPDTGNTLGADDKTPGINS